MKQYLYIFMVALFATVGSMGEAQAQRKDFHDTARYNTMCRQGVWSVGLGIEPIVSLTHPTAAKYGGQRLSCLGSFGVRVEGSYFVVDNMRLSATLGFVGNSWSGAMRWNIYDAWSSLSQFKFGLGAHWHIGRWDFGGGVVWGRSTFNYNEANVAEGGANNPAYGPVGFRDRCSLVGLNYEASYMLTPFLKVGGSYEPMFARRGGYAHSLAARVTIYLPFTDAVVCK